MKLFFCSLLLAILCACGSNTPAETSGGWKKYEHNPVLGGKFGTIFDISVINKNDSAYQMFCSWRPERSIALSESADGLKWSDPVVCLPYDDSSKWERDVNRPVVLIKDGRYHMWYTGETDSASSIGYATSTDGKHFTKASPKPVLIADLPWEKNAVQCPHVAWDENENIFKMWYSGGEQYEPDAIGYATSKDGLTWTKYPGNPIFRPDTKKEWEKAKVTACQVIKRQDDYLMFYIGFKNVDFAQIGMARSKDGISNWERFKDNPIIQPGNGWDSSAVYKPYAIQNKNGWLLYYNGRRNDKEQIGIAIHEDKDLGF
ncbi:glycoside hydrolase family protein [Flavihumibacter profundi]|uniref:hypothetical protein n=1 Tax=Flavihumibacter profundi TaxID=2716883 RepID=UPI001CC5FEEB|nr:hypothetical protein [Flavihumibacter profundi]MBZ5856922.1 hypothetical protein [Flavihumibacter profundi]